MLRVGGSDLHHGVERNDCYLGIVWCFGIPLECREPQPQGCLERDDFVLRRHRSGIVARERRPDRLIDLKCIGGTRLLLWTIITLPASLYLSVVPASKQVQICRYVTNGKSPVCLGRPQWRKMCATAAAWVFLCRAILQSAGLSHISRFVRGFRCLWGVWAVAGHNRRSWPFAEVRLDSVNCDSLAFATPLGAVRAPRTLIPSTRECMIFVVPSGSALRHHLPKPAPV